MNDQTFNMKIDVYGKITLNYKMSIHTNHLIMDLIIYFKNKQ